MAASKAFGHDKKWSTFSLFLIFILVSILVYIIGAVLSLGGGGRIIQTLLTIPLSAWTSVVIAYTYITHGPSATAGAQAPTFGQPSVDTGMSSVTSAGISSMEAPRRFCAFCGSPLKADSKFCANCGKPVLASGT